jgi:hypothetical protein
VGIPEFINVLQNFSEISVKEAENVRTLKDDYPFSQVLHALSARVCKDHGFSDSQRELQLAAVYAADRSALKSIIESINSPVLASAYRQSSPIGTSETSVKTSETDVDYATEVINDLERLNELRHNFELLFVDSSAISYQNIPAAESPEITEDQGAEEKTEKHESSKSKKERIIELAKSVENQALQSEETKTKSRKRKDSVEALIDHIVVSKEELSPESEKQKEQIELIDHFIKVQPTILGAKDKQSAPEDLTSIKTGDFNDSIISETLVEILLKQGKKEKAVEVLKKLIWKFPQKKAYFASQIEELKK